MRLTALLPLAGLLALAASAQNPNPYYSHSAYEPPAAAAAAALTASTKASPPNLLTTSEKTDWAKTGSYDEVATLAAALEKASPWVHEEDFGTSPEGRRMIALIVSKDRAFTPAAAQRTNKAVIYIQSGIHSGEIEGKDTALMLVRDMAVTKRYQSWLDSCIFVVVPLFNLDGHEDSSPFNRASQNGPASTGTRNTPIGLNLNRDYMKGDTVEMKGWLKLYNDWLPDFMFDNHVTDGADMQYDVTWDMARNQDVAEPLRTWINTGYVPELNKRMEADGHGVAPYGALRGQTDFNMEVFSPRYSHLYTAVQNRPCLLVETHSLKSTRTRAWADFDIMRHTIDIIAANPQALRTAVRQTDQAVMDMAGNPSAPKLYLAGRVDTSQGTPIVYRSIGRGATEISPITGAPIAGYNGQPADLHVMLHDHIVTTSDVQMPLGYLIPAAWGQIADELAQQEVTMERTTKPLTENFETYRFANVQWGDPATELGPHLMANSFTATLVKEKITIPADSYWVTLKQRRARLIVNLLEPDAPDSLARFGYFYTVMAAGGGRGGGGGGRAGGRGGAPGGAAAAAAPAPPSLPSQAAGLAPGQPNEYLSEPMARRLYADNPDLRAQFDAALKADPTFAADPQARLRWWFEHSPYAPSAGNRYPVVRVWQKDW